jgi:hypothetical protein
MDRRADTTSDMLIERIDRLPAHPADREHARVQFDHAERAAEWTVQAMDRIDALIEGMRRASRARQQRTG